MHQGRQEHRGIGEPAADDDVSAGLKRRHDGVGAKIGVHADDRHVNIGERTRLVHERLVTRHDPRDIVAFDTCDFEALSPRSHARSRVRPAAARGLAAPILVMMVVPAVRQGGRSACMRRSRCAL